MFVAGPKVTGGIVGKHPSLSDLGDGDLKYHTDFRSVYATLLDNWLGVESRGVLHDKFDHLPLVDKAKKVDAIFFGGYAPQGGPMARQMKQLGMTAKLLGGDTICVPEMGKLGGEAVGENVLCAQGGAILDKAASGPDFKAKYKKRFNQEPDVYAASFYDGMNLYADAMKKSNSTDVPKVVAEIKKGSYTGVAGTYAFDEKGNMKQSPVTVFTFKNGQPVPLTSY